MSTNELVPPSETPDLHGAFPRLSAEHLDALAARGQRRPTRPGEVLYREREQVDDFLRDPRRKSRASSASSACSPARSPRSQRWSGKAARCSPCPSSGSASSSRRTPGSGTWWRALLIRRSILIELGVGFRIVGSRYSPDTRRLLEFAARNLLPHRWIDLERDAETERLLRELGVRPEQTPVVIWRGQQVLRNPSNADLARTIGLLDSRSGPASCDLLVVGAGPAGLAAAVYGASEGLSTVALDGVATGGQAGTATRIENYLGFPSGISGLELAGRAVLQAEKFGARIRVPAEAAALERRDAHHLVRLQDGTTISARTVVIATGARYRRLDVPRLDQFEKTSVYYAATQVEARVCRDDPVAVVGGGNSAGQATLFLSRYAKRVRLLVREHDLGVSMSCYLVDRIRRLENVDLLLSSEVRELVGDDTLEAVVVEDSRTGQRRTVEARAMFVFIGMRPHAGWLGDQLALDDRGFILTGPDVAQGAGTTCGGSPAAGRYRWRQAGPASTRPVTCGTVRSSGWRQPSARAPWPCA